MKIIVNGNVYDSDHTPIVVAWDNDKERQATAKHLIDMESKDGVRLYASYPDGMDGYKIIDDALRAIKVSSNI